MPSRPTAVASYRSSPSTWSPPAAPPARSTSAPVTSRWSSGPAPSGCGARPTASRARATWSPTCSGGCPRCCPSPGTGSRPHRAAGPSPVLCLTASTPPRPPTAGCAATPSPSGSADGWKGLAVALEQRGLGQAGQLLAHATGLGAAHAVHALEVGHAGGQELLQPAEVPDEAVGGVAGQPGHPGQQAVAVGADRGVQALGAQAQHGGHGPGVEQLVRAQAGQPGQRGRG